MLYLQVHLTFPALSTTAALTSRIRHLAPGIPDLVVTETIPINGPLKGDAVSIEAVSEGILARVVQDDFDLGLGAVMSHKATHIGPSLGRLCRGACHIKHVLQMSFTRSRTHEVARASRKNLSSKKAEISITNGFLQP